MKVVILAAGYATRLYPLTRNCPKALLRVGSQTILDHLMDHLRLIPDISEAILVTNHRFEPAFSDWAKTAAAPFKISVLDDLTSSNEDRLGAIGDLILAVRRHRIDEDLLVLASDNLFDGRISSFVSFAQEKRAEAAIGVYDIRDRRLAKKRYGVVHLGRDGRVRKIDEKPEVPEHSTISMGVYYFARKTLPLLAEYGSATGRKDAPGHYAVWLLSRTAVYGYLFPGRWYDIGSFDQLEAARASYR